MRQTPMRYTPVRCTPCEVYARKMHARKMHARKVHAHKVHAHKIHAHQMHTYAHETPMRRMVKIHAGCPTPHPNAAPERQTRIVYPSDKLSNCVARYIPSCLLAPPTAESSLTEGLLCPKNDPRTPFSPHPH